MHSVVSAIDNDLSVLCHRISIRKGISDEAPPQAMFHSLHLSFLSTSVSGSPCDPPWRSFLD